MTGFQKRNKDKKKRYIDKIKEETRVEKCEKRKNKRKQLKNVVDELLKSENDTNTNETRLKQSCEKKIVTKNSTTTVLIEPLFD